MAAVPVGAVELADMTFSLQQGAWLTHSVHGDGVVMMFVPTAMPDDGLEGLAPALPVLCAQVAARVMPRFLAESRKGQPAYVANEIRSGATGFGGYERDYFSWTEGACGDALK